MKLTSVMMLVGLGVAAITSPGAAVAATTPQSCVCLLSESSSTGNAPVGTLVASTGTVLVSGTTGFQTISTGSTIAPNAEVQTGPSSSAELQLGENCDLKIGADTTVTLTPGSDGICVAETVVTDTANNNLALGLGAGGLVIVGLGIDKAISH